jgi:hypothetical protein
MSADNWAICPKCLADAKAAADKERAEVYAKYGKVYGAEEGTVHFSYSGYCETCRLGLNFQIDKDLSL